MLARTEPTLTAFRLLPVDQAAPHLVEAAKGGFLSLTPLGHGTDGFFAALMQRADAV